MFHDHLLEIGTGGTGISARGLLAAVSAIAIALGGCGSGSGTGAGDALPIVESNLDTQVAQIGGATVAVEYYSDATGDWALYSMANRLAATQIGMTKGAATELRNLPGTILNITLVPGQPIALLAMGEKGIGVVDITNPAAMVYRGTYLGELHHPGHRVLGRRRQSPCRAVCRAHGRRHQRSSGLQRRHRRPAPDRERSVRHPEDEAVEPARRGAGLGDRDRRRASMDAEVRGRESLGRAAAA